MIADSKELRDSEIARSNSELDRQSIMLMAAILIATAIIVVSSHSLLRGRLPADCHHCQCDQAPRRHDLDIGLFPERISGMK